MFTELCKTDALLHLTHTYFKHSGMSHINSFYTLITQVTEPLMTLSLGGRPNESEIINSPTVPVEGVTTKKNSLTYAASLQGFS